METAELMEPTPELIEHLHREEVEEARRIPWDQKLLLGPQLFDLACQFTLVGLKAEHPRADEEELHRLLGDRIKLLRRTEVRK
jgi:hypothetical protein